MSGCLIDSPLSRKVKITLSDYEYEKDIRNRLLLASLSVFDIQVLEEILYSSLRIPISDLAEDCNTEVSSLFPSLERLSFSGLFTVEKNMLSVDKEKRKYFELQMRRTEDDFEPDLEFLHSLLKQIPIHVLPIWYAIPRTSDNIFESLIEKYLFTPQLFQRYVTEFQNTDPVGYRIVEDLYNSESLETKACEIIKKYHLTEEAFEEKMIELELGFLCCLVYRKKGDRLERFVTPFREWKEYIRHLRITQPLSIEESAEVLPFRSDPFAFVSDITEMLRKSENGDDSPLFPEFGNDEVSRNAYIARLRHKADLIGLIDPESKNLHPSPLFREWLKEPVEKRALFLYRHPDNYISSREFSTTIYNERSLREAEKSILRVLDTGWIFFEDFLTGCLVPLKEEDVVTLKRTGKHGRYVLPEYTQEERMFLQTVLFEWLFEAGIVQIGHCNNRLCFMVTPFGQTLFGP